MEFDYKDLKRSAREAMRLTNPNFRLVALVYFFMTTGLSYLISILAPAGILTGTLFFSLALSMYTIVMDFSYDLWSLWAYRKLDPGMGSLMQGFSVAGKVIVSQLFITCWVIARSFLFTLILMIPLIVLLPETILPFLLLLLYPVSVLVNLLAQLYFCPVPFLLADNPDAPARSIVRRSEQLMKGWKRHLFKLEFSFFGWYILQWVISILVVVGTLWAGGFFQALFSIPVEEIPTMVTGFATWGSGFVMEGTPQAHIDLFNLYYVLSRGPMTVLAGYLASLPVFLWLTPYLHVSRAAFYDFRMQQQFQQAPEL